MSDLILFFISFSIILKYIILTLYYLDMKIVKLFILSNYSAFHIYPPCNPQRKVIPYLSLLILAFPFLQHFLRSFYRYTFPSTLGLTTHFLFAFLVFLLLSCTTTTMHQGRLLLHEPDTHTVFVSTLF